MTEHEKLPVTRKAVVKRIRRRLANEGRYIISDIESHRTGMWCIHDGAYILEKNVSTDELVARLNVLKHWEGME